MVSIRSNDKFPRFSNEVMPKAMMFFLIDENIAAPVGGPHFEFEPHRSGPFDKAVYEVLAELESEGLVETPEERSWKSYRLTYEGQCRGIAALSKLPPIARLDVSLGDSAGLPIGRIQTGRSVLGAATAALTPSSENAPTHTEARPSETHARCAWQAAIEASWTQ